MVKKTVHRRKSQGAHGTKKATKTSIAAAEAERWTCAFDGGATSDADSSLALVRSGINGHRLRIIDVHTGTQRSEHAGAAKICSVAWGRQPGAADKGSAHVLVAMGLQSGNVQLYSPARNAVVKTLEGAHVDAVVAVEFRGDALFSLDSNGVVVQWDVASGTAQREMKTGLSGACALLVAADAQRVAVASHRIELWDVSRAVRLHSWPGHTAPVHTLLWAADEAALVSAADTDRHLHVWDATPDAEARPRAVLTTDSPVSSVDVAASGSVLAVGEDGVLYAWHQIAVAQRSTDSTASGARRNAIGYTADGVVRVVSTATPTQSLPILRARFSRVGSGEDSVLIVRGGAVKPLFETLSLAGPDGQFERELVLNREPQGNLLLTSSRQTDAEQQLAAQLQVYSEKGASVTDPVAEGVRASQRAGNDDADESARAAQGVPTLADRIKQLSVGADTTDPANGAALAAGLRLTAGTLVRVLVQSLHTADPEMLETVLSNASRPNIVRDTVLGLPTAYVLPFLQQLFERFHATPARATQLLPWIRCTLALHAAYLTSIPSLVPQLAGFYQGIEARLETHGRLLRLSGRLELANTQIRARCLYEKDHERQARAAMSLPMKPAAVYREADDSDDAGPADTEPPTPVWQAEESTDDEGGSGHDDDQWKEGSGDEEMGSSDSDSDSENESDSASDSGSDSGSESDDSDISGLE
ncbi:Small subunit (SSU) processome component [Coemansia sp. RSA 1807]|nr:Small subunit (SSU) processome component [Coemansia sp. RSA 1591]KAJ1788676.1 Small subunit (SSU) processome component [Coemansia sp. RSA 1938]KAJ2133420.1 Small subunit (SSU) processome component [Coemansia sp. RSA 921]KAJ2578081.1 Small subunit (SSU) processome component [Coemansia sp. RSA 1807]